jgi:hypothetical protein
MGGVTIDVEANHRLPLRRLAPLLAVLTAAPLASAATSTPAWTPPTTAASPTTMPSPATPASSSPSFAPSRTTTWRETPRRTPSPEPADVDSTPIAGPAAPEDGGSVEMPSAETLPTSVAPAGAVRVFRTPERVEPPPFVAPRTEPEDTDAEAGEPATDSTVPPDRPYIATVTFRAVASSDVDGFELLVIYPRSAGDFVGLRNSVDCRKSGDATLFADDHEDGTLRLLVASSHALAFPFDVVCRFTVEPNAILTAKLIAVNVAEVTTGNERGDPATLTVSVLAH